ncbi:unnamed protein product [Trifolium pratense]|uniref:Uncharacterized protein n=1 Tax=Trifolium pratense TaxID=57577 RepID=A0ACB0K5E9_TRIPR|nr:unnamed protein product [Trifolium pratense]
MKIFIEGIDCDVWDVVVNGPFVPTHLVNDVVANKPRNLWTKEDKEKVQYNLKAKTIISIALSMDEFYRVCLKAKNSNWYLDSGCSKHMTGDKSKFSLLTSKNGGYVSYGDNNKGKIIGIGTIGSDHVQKGDCLIEFVETSKQLADIFTKPLPKENFFFIRTELGILNQSCIE